MEEPPDTIFEEREELMVSPTGDRNPSPRAAHFLKPSVTSIYGPVFKLPSHAFSFAYTTFEPKKWPLEVSFNGWRYPQKKWKTWVDHMSPTYQSTWKKAGIYEAIMSSTYEIRRNNDLVLGMAERWCPQTNTFIFSWGEATVTLEDMMVLGGYSVLGDPVFSPLQTEESEQMLESLLAARRETARTKAQKVTQDVWMNCFMKSGSEFEHEALLALWLARYVFPAYPINSIGKRVFPIAIRLARGTRIAIAPAVLASIYRDLSLLKETIVASTKFKMKTDSEDILALTLWAPLHLVQIWAWERFLGLRPNPNLMEHDKPRLLRWHKMKKMNVDNVRMALDAAGGSFQWRPYATATNKWVFNKLCDNKEKWVSVDQALDGELDSFARCLRVSELVGLGCIEQYLPHRVAMQFGLDQDLPGCVARSNESPEIAWSNYSKPICDVKYILPRLFKSDVTTRYLEWWKQSFWGWKDAIKGVVRRRRSSRNLKSLKRLVQCSKGKMGNKDALVPPGFPRKCSEVEAGGSSNKHRRVENRLVGDCKPLLGMVSQSLLSTADGNNAAVPPGFAPKCSRVEAGDSSNKHTSVKNKVLGEGKQLVGTGSQSLSSIADGDNAAIPPGFAPKCRRVEVGDSSNNHRSVENRLVGAGKSLLSVGSQNLSSNGDSNNAAVPPGFAPKCSGVEARDSGNMHGSVENRLVGDGKPLPAAESNGNNASVSPGFAPKCCGMGARDSGNTHNNVGNRPNSNDKLLLGTKSQILSFSTIDDGVVRKVNSLMRPADKIRHGESIVGGSAKAVEDSNVCKAGSPVFDGVRFRDNVGGISSYYTIEMPSLELEARISKLERVVAELKSKKT